MIFSTVTEADVAGAVVVVVDPPKEKPPEAGFAAAAAGAAPNIPFFQINQEYIRIYYFKILHT